MPVVLPARAPCPVDFTPGGLEQLHSRSEGQKRDIARALDSRRQFVLVRRASSRQAPGQNLAALGNELAEHPDIFVIHQVDLFRAKLADFAPAEILFFPAGTAAAVFARRTIPGRGS
jgi:hypothetical protein